MTETTLDGHRFKQFGVRVPEAHYEALRRLAKAEDRSMNWYLGQVIADHLASRAAAAARKAAKPS